MHLLIYPVSCALNKGKREVGATLFVFPRSKQCENGLKILRACPHRYELMETARITGPWTGGEGDTTGDIFIHVKQISISISCLAFKSYLYECRDLARMVNFVRLLHSQSWVKGKGGGKIHPFMLEPHISWREIFDDEEFLFERHPGRWD